jgi:hypothetical protein
MKKKPIVHINLYIEIIQFHLRLFDLLILLFYLLIYFDSQHNSNQSN